MSTLQQFNMNMKLNSFHKIKNVINFKAAMMHTSNDDNMIKGIIVIVASCF